MRNKIANATGDNYYTYCKDYLSSAFPLVDQKLESQIEKRNSRSRWMNMSTDFDILNKRKDWNALPDRKPSPEAIQDLKIPYVQQIEDVR